MSKVLIDRELLERVKTLCEEWFVRGQQPHMSATDYKVWHAIGFGSKAFDSLRTALAAPSGTPAMPVKAYYHEVPNEYGGLNKSVGLEVRKEFADAPLVLESGAMECIACLEGEIAKRDARIVELESQYQRDVFGLNNEGDPIGGDPAGGYANDNARLRAELAAIKAQEPVAIEFRQFLTDVVTGAGLLSHGKQSKGLASELSAKAYKYMLGAQVSGYQQKPIGYRCWFNKETKNIMVEWGKSLPSDMNPSATYQELYAAPVPEAKAQGVVMPEHETSTPSSKWASAGESDPHGKAYDCERAELSMGEYTDDELANAVFMHDHRSFDIAATMRGEPGSIVLLTAAKDRIRWLSRSLDKALARLNAAPVQQVSVPDGWMLVPTEPTPGMIDAALRSEDASLDPRSIVIADYRAMLAAAPVQQVSVPVGFRVMKPTSTVLRDGDRWEIYAPCGSGGIVHEDDVTDWVVRKLLDAIADAQATIDGLRGELAAKEETANQWRELALQFDRHRMTAMAHIRAAASGDKSAIEALGVFAALPPIPGHEITAAHERQAQRIGELERLLLRVQVSLSLDDTEWGYSGAEKYKLLADIRAALSAGKEGE